MAKLAIVIGHHKAGKGAYAKAPIDAFEYDWNGQLAKLMEAHTATIEGLEVKRFFRDGVGLKGAYAAVREWGADAAMELRFNAAGPKATGTETLFVTAESEALAEAIQDATLDCLALRDRGLGNPAKHKGGRGKQNLTQMRGHPSVLTEPFFGSNPSDCAVAHKHMQALAEAQLEAAANVLMSRPLERLWEVTASKLNVRGGHGTGFDTLDWAR